MKKVLKFKFEDKEGFLSVVEKENYYFALVEKDTPKVSAVLETNQMMISYELKNPSYASVKAHVIFDFNLVKQIYETLEAEKNLYFKNLDERLCVIEIEKEN